MIPFASHTMTQQRFYIKNSNRTTQNGVFPFPISLSRSWLFLSDPNTILAPSLMDWRGRFRWWRHFSFWRSFHKHGGIGEHTHPVKSTITIFFEIVGGQSQGFVVGSWWLLSWNESKYLCVDSRNEILVLSEASFLLVSLSLSRDKMQAFSIDVWCRLVVVRALDGVA